MSEVVPRLYLKRIRPFGQSGHDHVEAVDSCGWRNGRGERIRSRVPIQVNMFHIGRVLQPKGKLDSTFASNELYGVYLWRVDNFSVLDIFLMDVHKAFAGYCRNR